MPEVTKSIRIISRPDCPVCNGRGNVLYSGMKDFSYAAPGEWGFRRCANKGCGTVWLDPAPTPEDLGKAYEGYYTHNQPEPGPGFVRDACWAVWHSYLGTRFGYKQGVGPSWLKPFGFLALLHPAGRDELDAAAMHLPAPKPGSRLLEVGCGSGVSLARMQTLGWDVEGVELDPEGVNAARRRGVSVRQGTLEQQAFPSGHFDAIYSAHVLEHLYDPISMLKECARVLKPGGRLVLLTPNVDSLGHREFGPCWLAVDPPRHLTLLNRAGLQRAAETAGLTVLQLNSSVRIGWVHAAISEAIRRTGRGEISELGKPSALLRGMAWQYKERFARRRDPDAGTELKLVATR